MTGSDPTIRPFEPGDLPVLQRIRERAFAPVFRSFRALVGGEIAALALAEAESEQAQLLRQICAAESGHRVLVVAIGAEIVGFVSFTVDAARHRGEIGLNAVDPDHAGKGIGAWMYAQVMARMKALGVAVVSVGAGGDSSHAPARRAYEKAGFGPGIPSIHLYKKL